MNVHPKLNRLVFYELIYFTAISNHIFVPPFCHFFFCSLVMVGLQYISGVAAEGVDLLVKKKIFPPALDYIKTLYSVVKKILLFSSIGFIVVCCLLSNVLYFLYFFFYY